MGRENFTVVLDAIGERIGGSKQGHMGREGERHLRTNCRE
jgi:hypothetical protein